MTENLYLNLPNHVVILDTETGGLEPDDLIEWDALTPRVVGGEIHGTIAKLAPPILEIGAILVDPLGLRELKQFHAYCGPEVGESFDDFWAKCDQKALRTNNFKDQADLFRNAKPLSTVLKDFIKWLPRNNRNEVYFLPAGQNVRYDIDMLNGAMARFGITQQIKTQPLELITFAHLYFSLPDTEIVANYKLTTMAEALGISTDGAHTALADVRMTAELFKKIFRRLSR